MLWYFEYKAEINPQLLAIKDGNREYSYQSLNDMANQYAISLRAKSVNRGDFVAVLLDPSAEFIICILAIVKLGATYVPLDTHAPKLRKQEILEDAAPALLITNETYSAELDDIKIKICLEKHLLLDSNTHPKANLDTPITSDDASLYMMYTSGSSGKPKGVIVPHRAVINITMLENTMRLGEGSNFAQFSSLAFDGSAYEIWGSLLNGATLCIIPNEARYNHDKLKKKLVEYNVTFLFLPTSFLHQIIKSAPDTLDQIKTILFGGEQVNATLIARFIAYRIEKQNHITLINGYGPTETTAYVCRQIIDSHKVYDTSYLSSIGQLVTNTKAYILDENMHVVTEGELYISGINLASGYHNSNLENEEKFLANPFSNEEPYNRLYKTGDKVRKLASGDLLCLGRFDDQVKIGGFRIHLNEIENELMKHPDITMASVIVELGGGSHKILTAYLILSDGNTVIDAELVREFIKGKLPYYMLPAKYVKVDDLPLTLAGKVDKLKLEQMPHTDLSFHIDSSDDDYIETTIKIIFQNLLNRTTIDSTKNLFELGASSLLITEACTRINQELKSELLIGDILAHPSIYKLSRFLEGNAEALTFKKRRKRQSADIAIIGMACRFPKANNLNDYWRNLCEGLNCLDRFDVKSSLTNTADNHVPVRGVLSHIEEFDASFFGFNTNEASLADPQQRLLLECAWEALEHAAIAPSKIQDKTVSLFAGMSDSTYLQENILKNSSVLNDNDLLHQRIACSTSMLSTQLSYRLNLKGRSVNINTSCSTGLIAVDHACQDLLLGHSDIAIAGAASIVVPQDKGYLYQPGGIVSKDGYCRPFSHRANGTVFSSGVGVIVLKPLKDAIEDNNIIYAVIKGRGVNNDGADKLGFAAPSTRGQMSCISAALEESKINAGDITYLEAHGTATSLGDIVELDALKAVYREQTKEKQYCALGSVKANIGHTDTAAGIAGIIKTALCLYHQKIPPLLHFEKPNPNLAFEDSPFYANKKLIAWDIGRKKRYAGISSFGVGGTNAHMILSEYDNPYTSTAEEKPKDTLLVVSAKTKTALEESTHQLISYLSAPREGNATLSNIAYTLQTGREDFQWRSFAVGKNKQRIISDFTTRQPKILDSNLHPSVVFMFPGQGTQYENMAMELLDELPEFAEYVYRGVRIANSYLKRDLLQIIREPDSEELHLTQYAQPALFIVEYALAKVLMDYGIKPHECIGHSLGEYVAACIAGIFSYEDGVALVCERGLLMACAPAGEMLAIACTRDEFMQFSCIAPVELALHNAPSHCVASGDNESINALENHLKKIKTPYQKLQVSHAFHSHLMEQIKQPFIQLFSKISLSPPVIPIVSNVTGTWLSAEQAIDPNYWYMHLRQTVQLCQGFETLLQDKHPYFIEIGLGHSLGSFVKELRGTLNSPRSTHLLPGRHKKTSDKHQFLTAIGESWLQGLNILWEKLNTNKKVALASLPTYPFQRQWHWVEPDLYHLQTPTHKLYNQTWARKSLISLPLERKLVDSHSWIIFKDEGKVGDAVISLLNSYGAHVVIIEPNDSYQEINVNHYQINAACKDHYEKFIQNIKTSLKSPFFLHLCSLKELKTKHLGESEITKLLNLSLFSIMYWTQSFTQIMGNNIPLKGLVLTKGTHKVTGAEFIVPVNATVHGACNVINKEHSSMSIRSIDIDIAMFSAKQQNAISVINFLGQDWSKTKFASAMRGSYLWELDFQPITDYQQQAVFKKNGIYLITGGLGAIALALCEKIAEIASNLTLILISRSPVIPSEQWEIISNDPHHLYYSKIVTLRKLKRANVTIYWDQADITDEKAVGHLISDYKHKFGHIDGLIHCAGVPGSGLIQLKTQNKVLDVLGPKLVGTYNLAKAFQDTSLDFVIYMSSLAALLGESGQFEYAAANACLDTFPLSELFITPCAISINWNTWKDIGMSVSSEKTNTVSFTNRGNDITSSEGQDLFLKIINSGYTNVAVSNYALHQHDLITQNNLQNSNRHTISTPRDALTIQTTYSPPKTVIEKRLTKLWQDSLGIDCVGISDNFFNLGGHSLKGLQLIDKVNKEFKCSLSIQHLYQQPTIQNFSLLIENPDLEINTILPLKQSNKQPPFVFLVHPASGMINCFSSFVSSWGHPLSIYGLQDPSVATGKFTHTSIQSLAKDYLKAIKKIQPKGPYYLIGYSFGGTICYEIANLLKQEKEPINLLALIESWCIFSKEQFNEVLFRKNFELSHPSLSPQLISLAWLRMKLLLNYSPSKTNQDMLLVKAEELIDDYLSIDHPTNGWSEYNAGNIDCNLIKANHDTILNTENSRLILEILNEKNIFH